MDCLYSTYFAQNRKLSPFLKTLNGPNITDKKTSWKQKTENSLTSI